MDQAAEKELWMLVDDLALPVDELDLAKVLRAAAVLRKDGGPSLPGATYLDAALVESVLNIHVRVRSNSPYRRRALSNQARVNGVKGDAQPITAPWCLRDASIAEVHPEQIGVVITWQKRPIEGTGAFGEWSPDAMRLTSRHPAGKPIPDRRAWDACRASDLAVVQPFAGKRPYFSDFLFAAQFVP